MIDERDKQVARRAEPDCGRKDEMMEYLYHEAGDTARAAFEEHLGLCDSCRVELAAFGRVRDEMSAWQVGFAPRTEVVLPRRKAEVLRELLLLFPAWVRGAALAAAAASVFLVAASIAGAGVSYQDGDFALQLGASTMGGNAVTGSVARSSEQIERLVEQAVAKEREKMKAEFEVQAASFKGQLTAEHQAQLQALSAQQDARVEAVRTALRAEIRRSSRSAPSIRSFFAMDDSAEEGADSR
ncbi:MAG: zf-HC2 domain-containing protein [Blastocatellia bacterium]